MWSFRKKRNLAIQNWRTRARWIDFRKTKLTIIYTAKAYMLSPSDKSEASNSTENAKTNEEPSKLDESVERKETPNKTSDTKLSSELLDN